MNLLQETIDFLEENNYTPSDIEFIGSGRYRCSWEEYQKLADFDYDNGYGGQEVASDLKIYFKDKSIAIRREYDGSEWWELVWSAMPCSKILPIVRLKTDSSWSTLAEMHEK